MPRIAVDAMGSDAAPRVELEGVLAAVRSRGVQVILVGDEPRLRAELAALGANDKKDPIVVRHAPDVITMHDAPSMAVKQKSSPRCASASTWSRRVRPTPLYRRGTRVR